MPKQKEKDGAGGGEQADTNTRTVPRVHERAVTQPLTQATGARSSAERACPTPTHEEDHRASLQTQSDYIIK